MMAFFPDLGKYAFAVLGSYGASLAILAALLGGSLWQSRRAKRLLSAAEERLLQPHWDAPKGAPASAPEPPKDAPKSKDARDA